MGLLGGVPNESGLRFSKTVLDGVVVKVVKAGWAEIMETYDSMTLAAGSKPIPWFHEDEVGSKAEFSEMVTMERVEAGFHPSAKKVAKDRSGTKRSCTLM